MFSEELKLCIYTCTCRLVFSDKLKLCTCKLVFSEELKLCTCANLCSAMKYATRNNTKNKNSEAENRQQHSLFTVLLLRLLDHADGGHTAQPLFERAECRTLRQ